MAVINPPERKLAKRTSVHWTTCSHIDKSVRIRRMKLIRRGIRQRTVSMSMSIVIVIAVEGNQYVAGDWRAAGRAGVTEVYAYLHRWRWSRKDHRRLHNSLVPTYIIYNNTARAFTAS